MGIFSKRDKKFSNKNMTVQEWLERYSSEAVTVINKDTALKVAAAYNAVNVISSQIAMLPIPIYKTTSNKGREKIRDHAIYKLLNVAFNEFTTAYDGWKIFMANCLTSEAGYIYIKRKNGIPVALYPINSDRVTKSINLKTYEPKYTINWGKGEPLTNVKYTDMIEVKGLCYGINDSTDPMDILKNVLGLTLAAEDYSVEYFKNGIHPSGVFEMPGSLSEEQAKRFKEDLQEKYSGLGKRHKALLLEDGMKFNRISAPPQEGQTIESRKFQILEIARFFNIPPNKLMEFERATWNNLEEMNISFVNDTLMPWITSIEQQINMQLLMPSELEQGYYAEFNINGLLRGKLSERYNSYAQARQWGWLSVNEIREKENMSNIGPQGDIYLSPSNMVNSDEYANKKEGGNEEDAKQQKVEILESEENK